MIVKNKIASRMIKQLLNLVFAKYRDYQSRADQLFADAVIIDLRDTDKSRYFAQPRPIIAHYVKVKIIVYSRSHNRGRRPQARGPRKTIEKDKCAIFSENCATLNVIDSRGYTHYLRGARWLASS